VPGNRASYTNGGVFYELSIFAFSVAEGGIALMNRFRPLKAYGYRAEAYYCGNCKIVIASGRQE
jgi:hypothetical protein